MGAGASIPERVSKEEAQSIAGPRWNQELSHEFDRLAENGTVPRATIEEFAKTKALNLKSWADVSRNAVKLGSVAMAAKAPASEEAAAPIVELDSAKMAKLQSLARRNAGGVAVKQKMVSQINKSMEYADERKGNSLDDFMARFHDRLQAIDEKTVMHDALLDTIDKMKLKSNWPHCLEVHHTKKAPDRGRTALRCDGLPEGPSR